MALLDMTITGWNEEDQCAYGIGSAECDQLKVNSVGYVARVNGMLSW